MATETSFALLLTRFRQEKGLSQYALAKVSGLTKQAISLLELGEREPSWETVQLLAQGLGVSCTEFLNPGIAPPAVEEARPRGRPAKAAQSAQGERSAGKAERKPPAEKKGGKGQGRKRKEG